MTPPAQQRARWRMEAGWDLDMRNRDGNRIVALGCEVSAVHEAQVPTRAGIDSDLDFFDFFDLDFFDSLDCLDPDPDPDFDHDNELTDRHPLPGGDPGGSAPFWTTFSKPRQLLNTAPMELPPSQHPAAAMRTSGRRPDSRLTPAYPQRYKLLRSVGHPWTCSIAIADAGPIQAAMPLNNQSITLRDPHESKSLSDGPGHRGPHP